MQLDKRVAHVERISERRGLTHSARTRCCRCHLPSRKRRARSRAMLHFVCNNADKAADLIDAARVVVHADRVEGQSNAHSDTDGARLPRRS